MRVRGLTEEQRDQPGNSDHVVFVGRRQGADGRTEMIMTSNDHAETRSVESGRRAASRAEREMIESEFGRIYHPDPDAAIIRTAEDMHEAAF